MAKSKPMSLITSIKQSYQSHFLPTQTVYIACSGGRDSMALLFACHQLGLPIHVLHVNHKLQAMSDDWQNMVESFCQTYHIPCQSFCLAWQAPQRVNEAQARTARYQAMAGFVPSQAVIATAHHANDQAETLLINLCKGAGLAGLVGMSELSDQPEFGKPIRLWRPLLHFTREEISGFVTEHQIAYIDDPTNATGDNQRAFLREQVLPKLEARFGNVINNINRTQTNLRHAKTSIDAQVTRDLADCQIANPQNIKPPLDIDKLIKLSHPRRFELLHTWVKGEKKFAPHRQLIEQIDALIFSQNPEQQAILYWQGIQIRRYRKALYRLDTSDQQALHAMIKLTDNLPFDLRAVMPNEKFCRLGNGFHEPFKKICQRLAIPSWDREDAKVLTNKNGKNFALVLPKQLIWLTDSQMLSTDLKYDLSQRFTELINQSRDCKT